MRTLVLALALATLLLVGCSREAEKDFDAGLRNLGQAVEIVTNGLRDLGGLVGLGE